MFYNDKFHRETLARSDESRWSFESVFPSFFAVKLPLCISDAHVMEVLQESKYHYPAGAKLER